MLFARVELFVMGVGSVILIWKLFIVLASVNVWPIKMKTTAEQQFLVVLT